MFSGIIPGHPDKCGLVAAWLSVMYRNKRSQHVNMVGRAASNAPLCKLLLMIYHDNALVPATVLHHDQFYLHNYRY
jgi:hypothetical protein